MENQTPHFYSIQDAAKILGVKRTSLYTLIDQGHLERIHIGRRALISRRSLDSYVKSVLAAGRRS